MTEIFNYITVKLLLDADTAVSEEMSKHSEFLKAAYMLDADTIVAPLAEGTKRDPSLGEMWRDVPPVDGEYKFEVATELPYYLPDLNKKPEFVLQVEDHEIFVSNRMVRAFFGKGLPEDDSLKYALLHRRGLSSMLEKPEFQGLHALPMKTFVSRSFTVQADNAEQAVIHGFLDWRDQLLGDIALVVDWIRAIEKEKSKHLMPLSSVPAFPIFWVLIVGGNSKRGCQQFNADVGSVAFRASRYIEGKCAESLASLLKSGKTPDTVETHMALSVTFHYYGFLSLALVHVCTACEVSLSRLLRSHLAERGISQSALDVTGRASIPG